MIPKLIIKKERNLNCSVKKSDKRIELEKEWLDDIGNMNNIMIPVPSFYEWLSMKQMNINFKLYSKL